MSLLNRSVRRWLMVSVTLIGLGSLSAALADDLPAVDFTQARVLRIGAPIIDERIMPDQHAACRGWRLTKQQAQRFFKLSQIVDGQTVNQRYYWLPCRVEGQLQDQQGRRWLFSINAASYALLWRPEQENEPVRLGCAQQACAPFNRIMPDSDQPVNE